MIVFNEIFFSGGGWVMPFCFCAGELRDVEVAMGKSVVFDVIYVKCLIILFMF